MDTPFASRIAIATPFALHDSPAGGKRLPRVTVEWHRARSWLVTPTGYSVADIICDGYETGEARNRVVREALDKKLKYLFFLDWDVLVPSMTLVRLIYLLDNNPDYDIASGVYCMKQDPAEVLLWKEWGNGVHWDWTFGDVLTDCLGVGTGCMLIRLSLFERLPSDVRPWFQSVHRIDTSNMDRPVEIHTSDDLYFCRRATEEAAAKILVDTGILCGHINGETGAVYTLQDDSLPMKRYRAQEASRRVAQVD